MKKDDTIDPKKLHKTVKYIDPSDNFLQKLKDKIDNFKIRKGFILFSIDKRKKKELMNLYDEAVKIKNSRKKRWTQKEQQKIIKQGINLIKKSDLLDIEGWKREYKDKKYTSSTMLVNMELRNGMHTHFLVRLGWKYFDYDDGRYIIDDNYKYYDLGSKIYCLDYHQDCCLPLRRKFEVKNIIDAIRSGGHIDTETSVDPKSLRTFMESDIIQKVMQGAELDEWVRWIKIMLIINAALAAIGAFGAIRILWS